jgi:GMP synthase-like glutamine amidotransferase
VTLKDNHSLFALGRILTNSFYKIIPNIQKISNGEIKDFSELLSPKNKKLEHFELWFDPVMNYWLDKLSLPTIQYDDIDNTKIFFIEIPFFNTENLNKKLKEKKFLYSFQYFKKNNLIKEKIGKETLNILSVLNFEKIIEHIKTTEECIKKNELDLYIILACKISGKDEKGYFHFPSLFNGIYRRNKEYWKYVVASNCVFPNEEELKKAKCILIPGSDLSVHDDYDFLRKTEQYLSNLIVDIEEKGKYPNLKILGICFGLELIMNAFGGKLNESEWNKDARFGPEIINLNEEFWELNYVKASGINKRKSLIIAEAHSEKIIQYPPEKNNYFKTVGSSEVCMCEVSVDKKGKILMFQGHPEYSPGLTVSRSLPMLMEFAGFKDKDFNINSMEKFEKEYFNKEENRNSNFNEWRAICDSFMRYN